MGKFFRGWEAQLRDNTILREGQVENRRWDLTGKEAYFVKHRASMIPGVKESFRVEKRIIGFYEGAKKICYNVEETTGKFSMEVIDNS